MKKLSVKIKRNIEKYPIIIGSGLIDNICDYFDFSAYSSVFIITDTNVADLYLEKTWDSIVRVNPGAKIESFAFDEGEENKNLETVNEIYEELAEQGFDRKGLIVNLGGGVTTDMGGFVATTYLRGVDFVNISTTVEGMVDASVGGKTGVNLLGYKNYVGAFNHPKLVLMDVDTLHTLVDREFIAGFGEIIKHGLIYDKVYYELVTSKIPKEFSDEEMIKIIYGSCKIKSEVVQKDEKEAGLRRILNFGHTVGHAIEKLSFKEKHRVLHGEAVSIGMVAAAKISQLMGEITIDEFWDIEKQLQKADLPVRSPIKDKKEILKIMQGDKKVIDGKIKWTLLTEIGHAESGVEVDEKLVIEAVEYVVK